MKNILTSTILCISLAVSAQNAVLYESKEYKEAYANDTRARNGLPGPNYWINRSEYKIDAEFIPEIPEVRGSLSVTYYNNSPDSLNIIVFKLMQTLYKKGSVRQMEIDPELLHDGIKISNVKFDTIDIPDGSINISGTMLTLSLPRYIKTNASANLSLDFITPIPPKSGLRSGQIDSSSFFIAYWFPQVAVYDDVFGWDTDQYVGVPENYNDISDYEVTITAPSHFNIWATGKHTNVESIYSKEIQSRIALSRNSALPVTILSETDFKTPDDRQKTWTFAARNVPDFAWGTSDHYIWEGMAARNTDLENLCWVQTAYQKGAANFDWVLEVSKNSIEVFSSEFPGIAYPYFKHITFSGTQGGGMEFPMLANNFATRDTTATITVTAHEIAHNYFPFMMGTNERKYGWLDETLTTLMEDYFKKKVHPNRKVMGWMNREFTFPYFAPRHDMLPLITETSSMMKVMPTMINYYVKGPAIMDILENLIGKNDLHIYLKEFMYAWQGKHPTPYDLFYFINTKHGKNLNWFWNASFFTYAYPDVAILGAEQTDQYLTLHVQNAGGLPIPFRISVVYEAGRGFDEVFNVAVWEKDLHLYTARIPISEKVEKVYLNQNFFYDSDPTNNEFLMGR
jgi:hypothetical protein